MLNAPTISQIQVASQDVYAFRINGEIESEDLAQMAVIMNDAFDSHEAVSMLMIFAPYDGAQAGAGLDLEVMTSQFRSVFKVNKYAVVGASSFASTLINILDKIMPVDARTFSLAEEDTAWDFVGTTPIKGDHA